ncbi:DUF6402 family protein [Anaerobiospirillum thomasii]|uniref:Uncharacterized conserved protein n=1 Tax=Anaerobiospirillum thomasii TaxID=179995 RepID=A0A2X0WZL5_9GAMM|nr:DUF6402 family protein [Anaerobiospirillum thomasii]SPT70981.1 Uncharacterized conserved protein [Anaerobiospirillum thomasii]
MPAITRQGDTCTGHDDCPPSSLVGGESNVLIDGKPVGVVGSTYAPHGCDVHDPHSDVIASGSSTVFVNGKPVGRVGDAVSIGGFVASGSPTVTVDSLGPDDIVNFVKCTNNYIDNVNNLSKVDEVIFYTPQIARHEALKDTLLEKDQKGWLELSKMLAKWISGPAYELQTSDVKNGTAPIFMMSLGYEWFSLYPRWLYEYRNLTINALNEKGKAQLVKYLKQLDIWKTGGFFDFSAYLPKEWEKYYFNYKRVLFADLHPYADGMTACLATHSIRALAKGNLTICDNGDREITVSELYFYVHDTFQFEGDDPLGCWSKHYLNYETIVVGSPDELDKYVELSNQSFNNFRQKYNIGGDFLVLSQTMQCKEFMQLSFRAN